ncbi:MAG: hypothetical protein J6X50_00120 [Bacilli bacterium]|nr:hypothetical protein [Bacilli bacterium]
MSKKANYKNLTDYLLNDVPKEQNQVELTFDFLNDKLGYMPESLIKYGGITIRSRIGCAIIKAGFVFETRYKEKKIIASRNKEEAKIILAANNRDKTVVNKRIFLNVIFPHTAKYVNTKGNIGHEIIDIFGADDNKYYYYLNPWGLISKNNAPDVVISICQSATGLYKVLNKAVVKNIDKTAAAKKTDATNNKLYLKQKKKFKYNDKYLEEYFEENAGDNAVFVSFECEGIYEPKKPVYFAFGAFKQKSNKKGIYRLVSTDQGQTTRFVSFGPSDQKMLERIVDDSEIWKDAPIKSFKEYADGFEQNKSFEYFKELGIEDQELQYSNALKFFLNNQNLTNNFLKNIGCQVKKREKFNIDREEYNIDLLFTNFNRIKKPENREAEKIIIIENKIKANVTPTDNDKSLAEQIEKVYMHVHKIKKKTDFTPAQREDIRQTATFLKIDYSKIPSQLSKYYIYAVVLAKRRGWSNKKIESDIKCFFLCPNYAESLYETAGKEKYLYNNTFIGGDKILFLQEKYRLITYKDILPVFEKQLLSMPEGKEKYLLGDFVVSLRRQANDRDDSLEKSMIEMFYLRSVK